MITITRPNAPTVQWRFRIDSNIPVAACTLCPAEFVGEDATNEALLTAHAHTVHGLPTA